MPTRPYMKMYWGDYHRDTQHLTTAEHGAYLLLISHYWAHGPIENDPKILARVTKLSANIFAKKWPLLAPFFRIENGWIFHSRIESEIRKLNDISEKRSEAGKKGGRPKKAKAFSGKSTPESRVHKPEERTNPPPPKGGSPPLANGEEKNPDAPKRGTRLAADWQPTAEDQTYARKSGFSDIEILGHAERFRNYFADGPGRGKTWTDWHRAFCNWLGRETPGRHGAGGSQSRPGGVVAAVNSLLDRD